VGVAVKTTSEETQADALAVAGPVKAPSLFRLWEVRSVPTVKLRSDTIAVVWVMIVEETPSRVPTVKE